MSRGSSCNRPSLGIKLKLQRRINKIAQINLTSTRLVIIKKRLLMIQGTKQKGKLKVDMRVTTNLFLYQRKQTLRYAHQCDQGSGKGEMMISIRTIS